MKKTVLREYAKLIVTCGVNVRKDQEVIIYADLDMQKVPASRMEFDGSGHLQQYEGGYTDYIEAKERRFGGVSENNLSKKAAVNDGAKKSANKDWKQNRPSKLKFTYKEQKEFETIDDDIAALEEKIQKLDNDMMTHATNSVKLGELMQEKEQAESALEEKMDRWVYLNDLAEKIEAQKNG